MTKEKGLNAECSKCGHKGELWIDADPWVDKPEGRGGV